MPPSAPSTPWSHVLGAPANVRPEYSSGYSPKFHTLPSSSCAKNVISDSCTTPSLVSRSQTTTVSMPATTLVRSVTVIVSWCSSLPVPRFASPSSTVWVPGTIGK
jgi:hypothetical protein